VKSFYATVIDVNYAAMALNLCRSFSPFLNGKTLGIFCIDDAAAKHLSQLKLANVWVLRPADFETRKLASLRRERAINEYCWTLKSAALQIGFSLDPAFDWAVYLDSDTMAFSDPDAVLTDSDVAVLSPHRFSSPEFSAYGPSVGRFNAGYIAFRNDPVAKRALDWWHERCIDDCPALPTDAAYADQKYLDELYRQFAGVCASEHKGLNAAPWNIQAYDVVERDGQVLVDGVPLLIYHFQGLKIYGVHLYDLYAGPMRISGAVADAIYRPFIRSLRESFEILREQSPGFRSGILPLTPRRALTQVRRFVHGTSNLALA
jgi:hypothetical protein